MKLWLDATKPMPKGYNFWCKSVNEAKELILKQERLYVDLINEKNIRDTNLLIRFISVSYRAGKYKKDGGDYIELLNWLEKTRRLNLTFKLRSKNPIHLFKMRKIIKKRKVMGYWEEVR
jgi:hypothetical protein